ncbi:MAG TPA: AAA family ATPase, partial [Anaerolineales bacterium]|nr:AAA family ATPase [Anaerolineales bacterium]
MTDSLIQTKFRLPIAFPARLSRPRLVAQLQSGWQERRRLSLVSAPAGSGKTTLLSEWARSPAAAPVRFAWLSLDEQDNDPLRFWSGCLQALEPHLPGPVRAARLLLDGDPLRPAPLEQVPAILINACGPESQPVVLVLDDYHVIQDGRIHAGLAALLERMPVTLHLAIASRSEPPLHLARLRARRQLTELNLQALTFSEAEAEQFLNSAMHLELSPEQVAALEQRTEGWIAGLQLAAIAMQAIRRDDPSGGPQLAGFIQDFRGSHRHIFDYLGAEVLARQPEQVQAFLLQSSLLERLSAPLCEAVLETGGCQAMLETLERLNLFLIPLDSERHWYRYHALWAEMLQAGLVRQHPERLAGLHRRASEWFEAHGYLSEAITHALQAGQVGRAADLIEPAAKGLVLQGQGRLLLGWLEQVPPATLLERPALAIARAWAWVLEGRLEDVESSLEQLDAHVGLAPASQGEMAAIRAIVATIRQDLPAIQAQASLALQNLPADDHQLRAAMALSLGTAACLSGQALQAVDLLEQAIRFSRRSHQSVIRLVATTSLAGAYEMLGKLGQAARLHRQVIALESDPLLGSLPLIGVGYVGLGGILHEWLLFDEAEAALQKGLSIGQHWGSPEIQIGAWFSLARLRFTQGRLDEALEMLDRLDTDFLRTTPHLERSHIQAIQAGIWLARGQLARVRAWEQACVIDEDRPIHYGDEQKAVVLA